MGLAKPAGAVAILFVFWVLLSGYFTPFLLTAGAVSAILVVAFTRHMLAIDREPWPIKLAPYAVAYFPWLAKEIVKSGWDVTKIILQPSLPISPTLVRLRPTQQTTVGIVTYANSITLTPGTITVEADREAFLIHALTRDGAEGLLGGDMDRRVTLIERNV